MLSALFPWLGKPFRFTMFRLLENAFVKFPPPLHPQHDLTIRPPMCNNPHILLGRLLVKFNCHGSLYWTFSFEWHVAIESFNWSLISALIWNFQCKSANQLAIINYLYLNHFCNYSYSMLIKSFWYLWRGLELDLISYMRLDSRKSIQFVESACSMLHQQLKACTLNPLRLDKKRT